MSLRKLLPQKTVSEETLETLSPVFEGEILFKQKRFEQSAEKYREALENFPPKSGGRFLVYNKLGIVYERLEKFQQAIEMYENCVKEGSITPFTYQRLACLYLDSGNWIRALNYCRQGIRCLKYAKTDFFQEIYFWFVFQNTKRKIRQKRKKSEKV